MPSTDLSNRILSCGGSRGGGGGDAPTTLALSRGASRGGDGDKKGLAVIAAVGLSLAGALAFAYTRPADNKW